MNAAQRIVAVSIVSIVSFGLVSTSMGDNVAKLIDQLGSWNKDKAKEASNKLAAMGKPVVPEVTKALNEKGRRRGRFAARTLRDIGQDAADAIPALFKSLDDSDALTREYAIEALAKMARQADQVIPMLQKAMDAGNEDLREQARLAIVQLTELSESQAQAESANRTSVSSDSTKTAIESRDMTSTVQQKPLQPDSSDVNDNSVVSIVNSSSKRDFAWPGSMVVIRAALLTFVIGGFFLLLYLSRE